ncbi:MAG: hypothetical protein HYY44_08895 [Deltaproteobacteria bacterium]|nr:hypothetical protein [Deltaproteobacteria bacterium]MBI4373521.1 hypothetical protein [Deltaproteobacteria bacterium]
MVHNLSVSEARQKLPSLLKAIQKDPALSFQIRVREEVVATLSSVKKIKRQGKAIQALLKLMKKQKSPSSAERATVHSENFKDFLYKDSEP